MSGKLVFHKKTAWRADRMLPTITVESLHKFEQNFYQQWYELSEDVQQVIAWPDSYNPDGPIHNGKIERIPGKIRQFSSIDFEVSLMHWGSKRQFRLSPNKFKKHELEKLIYVFEKLFWGFDCKVESSSYFRKTGKKVYERYELILTKQKD